MCTPIPVHSCNNVNRKKLFYHFSLIAMLGLPVSEATAGGFQLSDHSVTSLGRSHAGYGLAGDDASAVQFNPAAMTLLKKSQLQLGFSVNDVTAEVEDTGSTGANAGGEDEDGSSTAVVPNAYAIFPFNDKLVFGLGVTAPFGTNTDYTDDNFVGRYNGTQTELTAIDLNPSFAYKINDNVSIGGGVSVQTLDVTLASAVFTNGSAPDGDFEAEGDSVDVGYNLGIMLSVSDNTRLGLSYRSGIEHDVEGDGTFSGLGALSGTFDVEAAFETPATVYAGLHSVISDSLGFSMGVRWTEWSTFEEIRIEFPDGNNAGGADNVTPIEWEDSLTISMGFDGRLNDKWGWRTGLAFDETPVPTATRSVRTIDSDRLWFSLGGSYKPSPAITLDFAYRYIYFESADINQETSVGGVPTGTLNARFENPEVHSLALQLNYKL